MLNDHNPKMVKERLRNKAEPLAFGKKLPTALYTARPKPQWAIGQKLTEDIMRAELAARPSLNWNLLKIHTSEPAIGFFCQAMMARND
jgi:hypothetical protein